jgi:hypothetical protein
MFQTRTSCQLGKKSQGSAVLAVAGCNSRQETKKLMNEWWGLIYGFSSISKYYFAMALNMTEKTSIEIN